MPWMVIDHHYVMHALVNMSRYRTQHTCWQFGYIQLLSGSLPALALTRDASRMQQCTTHTLPTGNNTKSTSGGGTVAHQRSNSSDTGTRTLVSCVKGKYANHLHHIGLLPPWTIKCYNNAHYLHSIDHLHFSYT